MINFKTNTLNNDDDDDKNDNGDQYQRSKKESELVNGLSP